MLVSVIICTYGRSRSLGRVLDCLRAQSYGRIEVIVVEGQPETAAPDGYAAGIRADGPVRFVPAPRGLTIQRNAGLRHAAGDLVCFLDDDVSFENDFVARIAALFELPGMGDVGGVTGYDLLHYPSPVNLRWRLRWLLGAIPSLRPGDTDHLGRAVPVSFLEPYSGCREVGWLSGFCMIYRRSSIAGLEFDQKLPTYGGEDRDFSLQVAKRARLMLCGDLELRHHYSAETRDDDVERVYQTGFGVGRRFAKYARGLADYWTVAKSFLGDLAVDL